MEKMNHNSHYLKLLKIPVWQVRGQEFENEPEESLPNVEISVSVSTPATVDTLSIQPTPVAVVPDNKSEVAVIETLEECTRCKLNLGRTQVVTSEGSKKASLFVITEAPTSKEDMLGKPFSEDAEKLFHNMLNSIGYSLDDVYITPYVKCSPYQSFITEVEEDACFKHLQNELEEVKPEKILLLGRNVAKYLLKHTQSFDHLREGKGSLSVLGQNVSCYVSYNPYQLLKFPEEKRKVWSDLKKIMG